MYTLSRSLLLVGVAAWVYIGVALLPEFGMLGFAALGVCVLAVLLRRKGPQLTTLGSARWATETDLRHAGMLHADTGLVLGRVPVQHNVFVAVGKLLSPFIGAKAACLEFFAHFQRGSKYMVRLPQAVHTAVFSPTGGGKGVSCVVPFLLTNPESCVVVDFKGENAKLTAAHRRRKFGHKIVMLDPFRIVSKSPDSFNPLDFIDANSPVAIDECLDLANALVIRTFEEKEPHWNDSAEAWIASFLATIVRYGGREDGTRSLQTLRELLSNPQRLEIAMQLMCSSDAWGGMLARMGGQLSHYVDKERSSTLTTVARHLRFLDTLAVADCTKASSYNPAALRSGKMTIYLILPPEHMRAKSGLLRLWIGSLLRAVVRGGLQERKKVHFLLDEAASLGQFDAIDDAVDKFRGYGVRLTFIYQSIGQLRKCFPAGQEQTLLGNVSKVFFGVAEPETAEYVSNCLGEETIVLESGGTTSSRTRQFTDGAQPTNSTSWADNSTSNWQQQARKLLKPEEVIALPPRTAITFTPGVRPIFTTLLRYYEEKGLGRCGWFWRCAAAIGTLIQAATLCAASVGLAFMLAMAIEHVTVTAPPSLQEVQDDSQKVSHP